MNRRALSRDANPTPTNAPFLDEPRGNQLRRVARNREADSLRRQDDGGVHANDLAARIHERTSGVAGIQCRIRLDDVVHEAAGLRAHGATQRTHHAGSDGLLEPVRTADGDGDLADSQGLRITKANVNQMGRVDAHDSEVRVRVVAHKRCRKHPSVCQRDFDLVRGVYDMAVRQQETIGRDDKARAAATLLLCWPSLTFTLAHTNVNHSRFSPLDNSRHRQGIPVEQFIVIDGRLGRCLILRRIEAVAESANDFSRPPILRYIEYFHKFFSVM